MQSVKQHDNVRRFPNAASITTGVRLDKIMAVAVNNIVLTAESLSAQAQYSKDQYLFKKCFQSKIIDRIKGDVRQKDLQPLASKQKSMKLFIH